MAQIYSLKPDLFQTSSPPPSLHLPQVKAARLIYIFKEAALPLLLGILGILITTLWLEILNPIVPVLKRTYSEASPPLKKSDVFPLTPEFELISLIEATKIDFSSNTPLKDQEAPSFKIIVENDPDAPASQNISLDSETILSTFNLAITLDHNNHLKEALKAYETTLENLKKNPTALPLETQHQLIQRYIYLKETLKEKVLP